MRDKPRGGMNQKKRKSKEHSDVKEDKKLVKEMVKSSCMHRPKG